MTRFGCGALVTQHSCQIVSNRLVAPDLSIVLTRGGLYWLTGVIIDTINSQCLVTVIFITLHDTIYESEWIILQVGTQIRPQQTFTIQDVIR